MPSGDHLQGTYAEQTQKTEVPSFGLQLCSEYTGTSTWGPKSESECRLVSAKWEQEDLDDLDGLGTGRKPVVSPALVEGARLLSVLALQHPCSRLHF